MDNYIELGGVFSMNSEKDEEDLFNLLSDNGFEYVGSYRVYNNNEMQKAISLIISSLDENKLTKIRKIIEDHYQEYELESTIEFLRCNSGTGIFSKVFKDTLEGDALEEFEYYSDANWMISDEFEGTLGDKVANMY